MIRNLVLVLTAFAATGSWAAEKNSYVSDIDRLLTIHRVAILPVTDNVNGIYSRYMENKLGDQLKNTHRFDSADLKDVDSAKTIDDYEKEPGLVKSLSNKTNANAVIGAKVVKLDKTVDITIDLFLLNDGNLFLQETGSYEGPRFDKVDLEKHTAELYAKLLSKLPYKGLVLSRQGNRVTIDVGALDGIKANTIVSVEQIVAIKRHPKFRFLLSADKEILGKVKILKVDDTLSFGIVLQEKAAGVVDKDSKLTGLDFVTYEDPTLTPVDPQRAEIAKDTVSFGRNPKEWVPESQPQYGRLGIALGVGSLRNSVTLSQNSYSTDSVVHPELNLDGELWITPSWFIGGIIREGVMTLNTPNGGSPSNLNTSISHYDLHLGYRFLLQDEFFGPQINLILGFSRHSLYVDASTPLTYTSTIYQGMYAGLGGWVPISYDRSWVFDVLLTRHLFPILTESPASSGASSDNSVTTFGFGGSHKMTNRFSVAVHLNFEFYSTNFSGVGSRGDTGSNSSQSLITLFTGIDYYL